jgi:uncharacterized protein YgbK (DUF1537 family)
LLRGHVDAELRACLKLFDHCVLAPAFPFQGRITRSGRKLMRTDEGWRDTGVVLSSPVLDAETEADLDAIVERGRALPGRVLWCSAGGLAAALAGRRPIPCLPIHPPILALIGSNHPVTRRQLAAAPAAVTADIPPGTPPEQALRIVVDIFVAHLSPIDRPATLLIAGGETLRAMCIALGAENIVVDGEIEPGVPTSILRGGAWDGQRIVSKSGAFGDDLFLARMLGV